MATTRIMPLHVGKGRTESRAISDIIDYVANPQKTDHGRLITGYECDSRVADAEFMLAKRQYIAATGRVRGADDVIAYHVRQSFCPEEITPEDANRLGVEFAKRFTKSKHAFIVCTHIDKAHVHNHIIWSSVNLDCDRKFRNFWGSTKAVRRLSDTICIENGLSIVENPKPHGKSYDQWLGNQAKPSHRELLRAAIDNALAQKPTDLDALLKLLRESGCEVSKRGKSYRLKLPGWAKCPAWTAWAKATPWRICWLFSPVKRSIRPAKSRLSKLIRRRSICWLTSRQSSRPEKVPDMRDGPRSLI